MKKEAFVIFIVMNIILLLNLVLADTTAVIKVDGKEYDIDLVTVNRESAIIKINNESKTLRTVQSAPYTPEIFSSVFPELKYTLTDLHYATYLGDVKFVNLLILFEKNMSLSGNKKVILSYGGRDYSVEVSSVVSVTQANIKLNNGSNFLATVQTLPYTPERTNPLLDLYSVLTYVDSNSANLLMGFELSLIFECSENWTCSNWSSCINNQQTQVCEDLNNCGTKKNIPLLTQDCTSEINITNLPPACTDECSKSAKVCFNESSFKSCLDNDDDNCTEWSNPVLCFNGTKKMACSNGECVQVKEPANNQILWIILGLVAIVIIGGFVFIKFRIIKLKKFSKKI